jgi:HD-GYP domain-containing protein (c-di-GMP phosphodiesterase class II)
MSKRRISLAELEVGSPVPWDAYDERGRLLLKKGQVISRDSQIERLLERGLFVEVQPARETAPTTAAPPPVSAESPSAFSLILEARRRLQLVCTPNGSKQDFPQQILAIRELIADACAANEGAALATSLLQRNGRYSIRHSVDVAVACQVIGSALNTGEPELTSMIAAALTMNISVLQLQDTLQAQQEPLSESQLKIIRHHPEASAAMLTELGVTDEVWIETVLSHHEAIDGSGYRHGRKGDQIPVPAQLVSLADVYCARVSSRDYRPGLRPNAALRSLFLDQGKKVRDGLASQFIKAIGVFPPGTPVRLENGEIGLVIQRGESASTPQVCSTIGPRGMPLVSPIKRDTTLPTYAVREVVDWTDLGAVPSMHVLWGKGVTSERVQRFG